jgi:hypothetical protein
MRRKRGLFLRKLWRVRERICREGVSGGRKEAFWLWDEEIRLFRIL